jgi:hypothetical protein
MKLAAIITLSAVIGILAGTGIALLRMTLVPWDGDPTSGGMGRLVEADAASKAQPPRVKVESTQYDFGVMDFNSFGSHKFVFQNVGSVPVEISSGGTSCQCTLSEIESEKIPPGGSTTVTVQWNARVSNGPYEQTAVILTNDPENPHVELTVFGQISAPLRAEPEEINFGQLSADRTDSCQVELLCQTLQPLEIVHYKMLDRQTADHFELVFSPLSDEKLQEVGAKSGSLLKVTLKPGLPQGEIRQTILIYTNLESASMLEVPIRFTIVGDIEMFGPGDAWNSQTKTLNLGTIHGETGAKKCFFLALRGPYRDKIEFEAEQPLPDGMNISFGKGESLGDGQVVRVQVDVEIPKGTNITKTGGAEANETKVNNAVKPNDEKPISQSEGAGVADGGLPQTNKVEMITVKTTHPSIPKLNFSVAYQCQE